MSLKRFIYYNAVIGGWAGLLVWLGAELLFFRSDFHGGLFEAALVGVLAGLAIGAALNFVSGLSSGRWKPKLSLRLILGAAVAAAGGVLGAFLYSTVQLPRSLGWMVMGLGIGAAEGVCEKSAIRIRNGLIGGAAGGFLGGLLFDPIATSGSDMSSRAVAFVILGVAVGALVGLTHVVLREAWLTVVDGFGPGRQLVLTHAVTVLGRGDHLPLPFLGYAGRDLDSEHLRIARQSDGQYVVEDIGSRVGTSVNGQPIRGPVVLAGGDLIRLGSNIIRFEHRDRTSIRGEVSPAKPPTVGSATISPPPPLPGTPSPPPLPPSGAGEREPPSPQASPSPPPKEPGPADSPPRIPPPPPPPG